MSVQQTFAMVKPDGVKRGLVGEVLGRIEAKGLSIKELKMFTIPKEMAEEHYGALSDKPFFNGLIEFITSGPVVAMVLEGNNAISEWRKMMGETDPSDSPAGSIRGDFATIIDENIVHGSDAEDTATREIQIFFGK